MTVSIVIPYKNDREELPKVIDHLLKEGGDYEIIVVNDGSQNHFGRFEPLVIENKKVRVINCPVSYGVGAAFDRGAEQSKGDILILMGADVFPHEGWYKKVVEAVNSKPDSIGCAVCVGDKPPHRKYYGADMLVTMDNDDLPVASKLRQRSGGYTEIFKGRWASKKGDSPYEISSLMGAFYFTTRDWYLKIGGFDTEPNNRFCGHRVWSHLEPHLSLKSYLHGGSCILYPDIEATHIFNRHDRYNKHDKGARSAEWFHWNSQWILETMVLSEYTRHRIRDFMHRQLNWNVAESMIRKNMKTIERYRERNQQEFTLSFEEYLAKFNIPIREYRLFK